MTTLAFAADHAGYEMKQELINYARELDYETLDFGTDSTDPVDYPDCVPPVVEAVLSNQAQFGILICGSGIGIDIAANRNPGIRSALCHSGKMAESARSHNNANILCLGSRYIGIEVAKECLKRFAATEFEAGGRHERRVKKLG